MHVECVEDVENIMKQWLNWAFPLIKDPKPRYVAKKFRETPWPVLKSFKCGLIVPPPNKIFSEVAENRRSKREITYASLKDISKPIIYATYPRLIKESHFLSLQKFLSPSAGALNTIQVLIITCRGQPRIFKYNSSTHSLDLLKQSRPTLLRRWVQKVNKMLPNSKGTIILYAADYNKIDAVYQNCESLFWRESGTLLQTIFLCSTAYNMAFCPLGILGNEAIKAIGLQKYLRATGIALIGN